MCKKMKSEKERGKSKRGKDREKIKERVCTEEMMLSVRRS